MFVKKRFQSHAGSIEASLHSQTHPARLCFNPTLVRLRRRYERSGSIPIVVSIPRWFD